MKIDMNKYFKYVKWIYRDTKPFVPAIVQILIIEVFGALGSVAVAIISKNLVDQAVASDTKSAISFAALFGGLVVVNLGLRAVSSLISARTLESFSNSMRERLFTMITGTEWSDISKYHSGDLLTRLTSDVGAVANGVIHVIPQVISLGVQLLAAFGTLLFYEPYLAVLAFVMAPITLVFSRFWGRKLKHMHVKIQESESAYRSFIQESLENLTIIKSFTMEDKSIERIENLHNERMHWVIKRNRTGVAASSVLAAGYWAGYLLAFGWGAVRLAQKAITFGTMTAFLQLVGQVQGPFIGLSRTLPQIIATLASTGRLMELEALQMEKQEDKLEVPKIAGISFKDVSFSYIDEETVLEGVSADIQPGETVALMGPSGEGKTTIIRLLLALLRPSRGKVSFSDDQGNVHDASSATRDWIAYVPQGNTLFSGTIAENLRKGWPDATDDELVDAAKTACAWEFIEKLPEGLNTLIGERGLGLSEGQAQRISIARAILRKAPILILDEATSSLDTDVEMRMLEGIKNLKQLRTCLVITHRISALQICSRVLKLEEGTISESKNSLTA